MDRRPAEGRKSLNRPPDECPEAFSLQDEPLAPFTFRSAAMVGRALRLAVLGPVIGQR